MLLSGCVGSASRPEGAGNLRLTRGTWDISAAGSAELHSISNDQIEKAYRVEMSPQVGYFVIDRLEILAAAGLAYEKVDYDQTGAPLELALAKQQDYSVALGLQYNHDQGQSLVPFLRAFGGIVKSRREMVQDNIPLVGKATLRDETTAPFFGVRVGLRHFVSDRISADLGLGWKRVFYDDDFGNDTDDFSLVAGFSVLF
jgi:hypothetical protein